MEDAHIACLDLGADIKESEMTAERKNFLDGIAVFGVFDGHGGKSDFISSFLHLLKTVITYQLVYVTDTLVKDLKDVLIDKFVQEMCDFWGIRCLEYKLFSTMLRTMPVI